jgi:hypothetical protein
MLSQAKERRVTKAELEAPPLGKGETLAAQPYRELEAPPMGKGETLAAQPCRELEAPPLGKGETLAAQPYRELEAPPLGKGETLAAQPYRSILHSPIGPSCPSRKSLEEHCAPLTHAGQACVVFLYFFLSLFLSSWQILSLTFNVYADAETGQCNNYQHTIVKRGSATTTSTP